MTMTLKKILVLLFLCCALQACSRAYYQKKADIATDQWQYEIGCASEAKQGTYYVVVSSIVRDHKLAITQGRKNAIHGVLFKGYPGNGENGCGGQRPLIRDVSVYEKNKKFFDDFFKEGETGGYDYMRFVQGSGKVIESIKINRREYKIFR